MIAENGEPNKVNLDKTFFENLKFDKESLAQYRTNAAVECSKTLGDNPALCLSGGIDSQAMVLCWQEAGLKFDVIIGVFKDGLNKHDSDHAKMFCRQHSIPYKELEIDIVKLLTSQNYLISQKYKSYSPHFNVHYKIVEILAEQGYTGTCFGGVTPFKRNGVYGENFSGAPFHFLKIQDILPIPMQGSFLSFYPELTWAIGLQCEDVVHEGSSTSSNLRSMKNIDDLNKLRYEKKVNSYLYSGLKTMPQDTKFTGFELVKDYFAEKYNDGWTFEKRFRYPISSEFLKDKHQQYNFLIDKETLNCIESIYFNNIGPDRFSPS